MFANHYFKNETCEFSQIKFTFKEYLVHVIPSNTNVADVLSLVLFLQYQIFVHLENVCFFVIMSLQEKNAFTWYKEFFKLL